MTAAALAHATALVSEAVGDAAAAWDREARLPEAVVRDLGRSGVLCGQVAAEHGGLGLTSRENGELTAHTGSLCGSLRSLMTSQGIAAWTLERLGGSELRSALLPRLAGGALAAVAFSEPAAGSDLAAMRTEIRSEAGAVVVQGEKTWVTGAAYADFLVVFGRYESGTGVVVVPTGADGVRIRRIADPLGCRAAGHADVTLDAVRLPREGLLPASGAPLALLVTTALSYGRLSVAWGCVGILRACLGAAVRHAHARIQFGKRLAEHQLVRRHLAELSTAAHVATLACEHASGSWDAARPDLAAATVLAKHVAARNAAQGAAAAVQLLASACAADSHPVARAYRDAKLMEIIEGSTEICQLLLAEHALAAAA